MAIRTVKLKCLFPGNYKARQAWEKEHGVSLYPSLYLRGMVPGEGISIGFNGTSQEKQALCRALYIVESDEVSYEGCVVNTSSREERVMSDVWAICHYATVIVNGEMKVVGTGCSEFSGHYDATIVTVDATPEARADFDALTAGTVRGANFAAAERELADRQARELAAKRRIEKGKLVRVTRGRKVPKGTQGRVFWMKDDAWGLRLGIATSDRKDGQGRNMDVAWVAASNCDVVNERTGEVF